ncbi:MAG: hypothetical protein QM308_05625 [Bacillota bacterium]|nr:hypothetical protein [Bacillota bacterium]
MAHDKMKKPIKVNRKLISAVTLLVALALTVVFLVLGVTGRNMDPEGLYKLLPWLPTPSTSYSWRQALVPGAGLGDTVTLTFTPDAEAPTQEQMDQAIHVLVKRLNDFGWTDAAVVVQDGKVLVTLPQGADVEYLKTLLSIKGEFAFTDPDGAAFMTGENVTEATFGYADQTGTNIALSMQFDKEGKDAFAQKSTELKGQKIIINRDGQILAEPGIGEPITEGIVSISGFNLEIARENAVLLRSGALPFLMTAQEEGVDGGPLLGDKVQKTLIIALFAVFALVAVYLLVRFRLAGLVAVWGLLLQAGLSWFFAAIIGAAFTMLTLIAVAIPFLVSIFAVLRLYSGMEDDIKSGRSFRQSLKDAYARSGHAGLDVQVGLLLIGIVLIMLNLGLISLFSEVFTLSLLVALVCTQLIDRILLNETIHLFGSKNALYAASTTVKKEG